MEYTFIDTVEALAPLVDTLAVFHRSANLFMDFEGKSLSRHGTLSIISIYIHATQQTFLIDVTVLQETAFSTVGTNSNKTLKQVLEDPSITKVFFDVRSDSDALFNLYEVALAGVEDLQLMELATSRNHRSGNYLRGLSKCIQDLGGMSPPELERWLRIKGEGKFEFTTNREIFDERPLSQLMLEYCVQDVTFMPTLRREYRSRLCDAWWIEILAESQRRVELAQDPDFNRGNGGMTAGPSRWEDLEVMRRDCRIRTLFTEEEDQLNAHTAWMYSVENDYDYEDEDFNEWRERVYGGPGVYDLAIV